MLPNKSASLPKFILPCVAALLAPLVAPPQLLGQRIAFHVIAVRMAA